MLDTIPISLSKSEKVYNQKVKYSIVSLTCKIYERQVVFLKILLGYIVSNCENLKDFKTYLFIRQTKLAG